MEDISSSKVLQQKSTAKGQQFKGDTETSKDKLLDNLGAVSKDKKNSRWKPTWQKQDQQTLHGSRRENLCQQTVVVWWRMFTLSKFYHWFKTVFIVRKQYVPGDTYRFIWQTVPEVKLSYVYYRVGHMIGNLFVFVISFFNFCDPPKKDLCNEPDVLCIGEIASVQYEWLFYVTSIGIKINLVQAIWGLVLTLLAYFHQRRADLVKVRGNPMAAGSSAAVVDNTAKSPAINEHKLLSKTGLYWALHTFGLCLSIIIDIVYWALIHESGKEVQATLMFHKISEHGVNLPLMVADYCAVAFPVVPSQIFVFLILSFSYVAINFMYYAAGGLNASRTKPYLYAFLDWRKPGKALAYGIGILLALSVALFVFLLIDNYKFKLRPKTLVNQKSPSNSPSRSNVRV